MNRAAELELLSADTQRVLGDCVLRVWARRPSSRLDPATQRRVEDLDSPDASAAAVREDLPGEDSERAHARRRAWRVRAHDLGFRPDRNAVCAEDGLAQMWRVIAVSDEINGREYLITAEALA